MNWLAHLHLSQSSVHFKLGNLLADVAKGKHWGNIHRDTINGMKTHFAIDAFTDDHPAFKRSKARLGSRGHLRGVVIDLAYDHMLSRHWSRFSDQSLASFLKTFYSEAILLTQTQHYPAPFHHHIQALVKSDRLGSYLDATGILHAAQRVDNRLSQRVLKRENASELYPKTIQAYDGIEADFLEFFPELRSHIFDSQ